MLEHGLGLPNRKSMGNSSFFNKEGQEAKAYKTAYETVLSGIVVAYNQPSAFIDAINEALQSVIEGRATVDDALANAQTKIDIIPK